MTNEEHQSIIKTCGLGYEFEDIPAYIRKRDEIEKEDWDFAEAAKREGEIVH